MPNIQNPVFEEFLSLWNNPQAFAQISIDNSEQGVGKFVVMIDAPDCPVVEIPLPPIPRGNA